MLGERRSCRIAGPADPGISPLVDYTTLFALRADYNVAYLYYVRGEYTRALELYRTIREQCERLGDTYRSALCDLDQHAQATARVQPADHHRPFALEVHEEERHQRRLDAREPPVAPAACLNNLSCLSSKKNADLTETTETNLQPQQHPAETELIQTENEVRRTETDPPQTGSDPLSTEPDETPLLKSLDHLHKRDVLFD